MNLKQSDLEDLASIELTDHFVEVNVNKHTWVDEDSSRATLQDVCTSFVQSFLMEKAEWVSSLHLSLKECVTVLKEMETVLENFIEQLERIQDDIGEVRQTLAQTSVQLHNARDTERILWTAISRLVVPPEVVQIVTQTSEEGELGVLFQLTLQELLKYLSYRKGAWQQRQPTESQTCAHTSLRTCPSTTASTGVPSGPHGVFHLPFKEFAIYKELRDVLDSLTVFACLKVRDFLTRKLHVLTVPNTNVCIQQENNLKQCSFFVHFLRTAPRLLRRCHATAKEDNPNPTQMPYRITHAIYSEFKQHYIFILSSLYLHRIQGYMVTLNTLEYATTTGAPIGLVSGTLLSGFTRVQPEAPDIVYTLPKLTEWPRSTARTGETELLLGKRGDFFAGVFAPPLIPTLEKASGKRHSYEETLRSTFHLLSDAVTHEFLFTFDFFAGDTSVYLDVFQPTLQFIVDYVSEVILQQSNGSVRQLLHQHPHASVNEKARDDLYGLLMLIRLCHEYRFHMKVVRKLPCLDAFFDSVLVLLWPAFKKTFDAQLVALRCAQISSLAAVTAHLGTLEERVATIHPLVRNFTACSCSLLGIALGAALDEERMRLEPLERLTTRYSGEASSSSSSALSTPTRRLPTSLGDPYQDASSRMSPGRAAAAPGYEEQATEEVRQRAIEMIMLEDATDAAESQHHFVALFGNIDFLRVQVIHYTEEVVDYMLKHGRMATSTRGSLGAGQVAVIRDSYVLNQLHYMWTRSQSFVLPGEERHGITLADRFGFEQLQLTYDTYRTRLLEELLELYFPELIIVSRGTEEVPSHDLIRVADNFHLSWKSALDAVRTQVTALMYDANLANEIIAQVCMECLMSNSRFIKIMVAAVEADPAAFEQRPVRTLIVSNQTILLHMRSYSMHLDTAGLS